ncbi:tetratricopeptide repeat-containing sulfotransferase family protein [Henriciella mobilis]|uniref:Sulfotransferase family protein n=1 Tax=Henriciella mobilis TaxID=2305467 RepID=A0A399R6E2_9PROT|nr:sulfotransferase [Henriciella mobilis]RIJ27186.1 sulfotransferase family protein [Henriciella mobilis]
MPSAMLTEPDKRALAAIDRALKQRQLGQANELIKAMLASSPDQVDGWIARARLAQMLADFEAMHASLEKADELAPGSPLVGLMKAEALIHLGRILEAQDALKKMELAASDDAAWLSRLSEAWSQCGDFAAAERCARRAVALRPNETAFRFALSSALVALGRLEDAACELDAIIERDPDDFDAWYNRATLRKPTEEDNHVDAMRAALGSGRAKGLGRVQLNYALAHELEALGRYAESFAALQSGAAARRAGMAYKVERDVQRMQQIETVFDADFLQEGPQGDTSEGPVFILGLPRSGSTLVDRILSAHAEVESLGELTDFPMALTALCRQGFPGEDLVPAAAKLDPERLGQAYLKRIGERASGKCRYMIDKAPLNYLYIGLIAKALPNARIIHMRRDPMDNAFAMYKTLFRMGYPFSYDFNDLAAYMNAKDRLMRHWRALLPGRILDIDYEAVVSDLRSETERMLDFLGLAWDPACLAFHENTSPSATASAAQVRQPLYASSVGKWRRYEEGLKPLRTLLGEQT